LPKHGHLSTSGRFYLTQDTLKLFAVDEYNYRRLHRYRKSDARAKLG